VKLAPHTVPDQFTYYAVSVGFGMLLDRVSDISRAVVLHRLGDAQLSGTPERDTQQLLHRLGHFAHQNVYALSP
jgi:hypothetical protein